LNFKKTSGDPFSLSSGDPLSPVELLVSVTFAMITKADIINDLIIIIPSFLWAFFVINYLSRWIYNLAIKKGYPQQSATYFGRKIIHIFAAGLITLLIPFFVKEPFLPFLSALFMAFYTWWPHRKDKLYQWFQVKENLREVNFSIMWGLSILIGWFFDKTFWLGTIPALFMAFGDGVTGIVRNLKYKRETKAWEGSLAMLICCSIIGFKMGTAGIVAAFVATLVERIEVIDHNLLIPIVSFLILILFKYF
jgi:hypothetical protein